MSSSPTNNDRGDGGDLPADLEREPAPDMIAELGPLAYGLFALSEPGPLTQVRPLADSRAPQVPAQADYRPGREPRGEAVLGESGELDL